MNKQSGKQRKRRWWILLPLLALIGAGWWWVSQPKALVLVRELKNRGPLWHCGNDGFVEYCEAPDAFVARTWDGTLRWRVPFPIPLGSSRLPIFQVSPNGTTVGFLFVGPRNQYHVELWRQGVRQGTMPLPGLFRYAAPSFPRPRLVTRDNGQALVIVNSSKPQPDFVRIMLTDGRRVLAETRYHPTIPASPDRHFQVSSDGRAMFFTHATASPNLEYVNVLYAPGRIASRQRFLTTITTDAFSFIEQNRLLSYRGTLIDLHGRRTATGAWFTYNGSVIRRYMVQRQSPSGTMGGPYGFRVLDTRTATTWAIPGPGEMTWYAAVSSDGRYAACLDSDPNGLQTFLQDNLRDVPLLGEWVNNIPDRMTVSLYERPGHLRAQSHVRFSTNHWICFTPDNRYLVCIVDELSSDKKRYRIYRW